MKKVKNLTLIAKQGVQHRRLKLTANFSAKVIYERGEVRSNGRTLHRSKIGQENPDCCPSPPKKNGFYLCVCGKHIVYISDTENCTLRQIAELPENLIACFSDEL